jgi:acyl carrier protein
MKKWVCSGDFSRVFKRTTDAKRLLRNFHLLRLKTSHFYARANRGRQFSCEVKEYGKIAYPEISPEKEKNNMDEIVSKLSAYIAKDILKQPNRVIKPGEAIISSGMIDSFSLVDLGVFVEDNFGVMIADTELNADTFDTLEQLANLIQSRQ